MIKFNVSYGDVKMKVFNSLRKYSKVCLLVIDICIIFFSYFLTRIFVEDIYVNFDVFINRQMLSSIIISIIVYELFLNMLGVYKNITMYESVKEYLTYALVSVLSCVVISALEYVFELNILSTKENILASIFIGILMVLYRGVIRLVLNNKNAIKQKAKPQRLLIIGAGDSGTDVVKNIKSRLMNKYHIVGIIDDNKKKKNCKIRGIRIIGNRNDIVRVCEEENVDIIFFAISNISAKDRKDILNICQETGIKLKILPGIQDLIEDKNILQSLRDIEIEDILGRDPIQLDNDNISKLIQDNVIMVTGAGGSIGSELCRQIVKFKPKEIILLDIYENSLYDIELELKAKYKDIKIDAVIASIRDKKHMEHIFEEYHPYVVFHAAAHKHVPLMEGSPLEAIKNNVFGTYNVVNCCDKYNVKRFVLISTDKAVNPTNIMGATKRMCEMIIQAKNRVSDTEFVAVRFGNVLGSNGSVVPLFKKQIAKGGPVTVTHKEITRFFMTIPEAVQLVLQAITYAKGGEIFVLDMGEPVKIYDLAVSLIKLSGLEPNVDIPIEVTGLRPGEKLYEELLMSEEGLTTTEHDKIYIAKPSNITMKELDEKLKIWNETIKDENITMEQIKSNVKSVIPTYREGIQN